MNDFDISRAVRIIKSSINQLDLELNGLNVLTEAGSNYYLLTPIIAHFANANNIFVWIKDSKFGKAEIILDKFKSILRILKIPHKRFTFCLNTFSAEQIKDTDIVTNLGHVRPIDKKFIDCMKPNAAISLMSEKWEFRKGDVDIDYAKQKGIKVSGVWEGSSSFNVFDFVGLLALKLSIEAGFEVLENKILIISGDNFGKIIEKRFELNGAVCEIISDQKEFISLTEKEFDYDFVFLCDYLQENLNIDELVKKYNPFIVHLAGNLVYENFDSNNIYPKVEGKHHKMTVALDYLGLTPLIKLHTLGFKVGKEVYFDRISEYSQIF